MKSGPSAPVFPAVICSEFLSWCCGRSPPGVVSRLLTLELNLSVVYVLAANEDGVNRGEEVWCQRKSRKQRTKGELEAPGIWPLPRHPEGHGPGAVWENVRFFSSLPSLVLCLCCRVSRLLHLLWTVHVCRCIQTGRKNLFKTWGHHTLHPPSPSDKHVWSGFNSDLLTSVQ